MTRPPRMRPRFEVPLAADQADILDRVRRRLDVPDCPLAGQVLDGHALIRLPDARQSLLSPVLTLEVVTRDQQRVLIGRFSPQPNVWTGFMLVYGVLAMLGLIGLMYGFAQMTVDQAPWSMLAAPLALALISFVYGAAFIGQGLTADQMDELRAFVHAVLADTRACETPPPI